MYGNSKLSFGIFAMVNTFTKILTSKYPALASALANASEVVTRLLIQSRVTLYTPSITIIDRFTSTLGVPAETLVQSPLVYDPCLSRNKLICHAVKSEIFYIPNAILFPTHSNIYF
jgi:hypothetical protein